MNIGQVIKQRRALLGISQQDLSDYSGVGISTVKDLERGVGNPSIDTLRKILDVVGLEIILKVKQTIG
ncbi:MAG: helix-turn-helix transcriptional regulator [Acetobacter sp.]|nr:helix-turn-helix transcriptional regulator [Acetobacter sp.]